MSEEDIMKELRANGPVLFDFDAGREFQIYSSGIILDPKLESTGMMDYSEIEEFVKEQNDREVNYRSYDEYNLQWEHLTHSTLLIGWGYDEKKDKKYWLVRNSYGSTWGEKGNLRVRRGFNDFGSEGEVTAVTPVLL